MGKKVDTPEHLLNSFNKFWIPKAMFYHCEFDVSIVSKTLGKLQKIEKNLVLPEKKGNNKYFSCYIHRIGHAAKCYSHILYCCHRVFVVTSLSSRLCRRVICRCVVVIASLSSWCCCCHDIFVALSLSLHGRCMVVTLSSSFSLSYF